MLRLCAAFGAAYKEGTVGHTIYLADDEKSIRELLHSFLTSDGYEVRSFESGDALLEAFQQSLKLVDSFDVTALIEAIYTMIEQQQEACRVLIFQNVCPNVLRRMISLARDESISYWKRHLHHITDAELEMLYTHLSNGLMHVVVEGYEKYGREEVVRFVNRIVQCSLSQFQ